MDGEYLVYPLTFITAVVYALRVYVLLQTLVAKYTNKNKRSRGNMDKWENPAVPSD